MDYTPVTPFRRSVDAAVLKHQAAAHEDLPPAGANKWEVLRELAAARVAFGLSDRDLSVLQAIVSFHQATILGGNEADLIVFPSNKAICERLNGMPCSTMRRHLGNLVQTGFLLRRDSPNGKRYARQYADTKVSFGFDLSALVRRFPDICAAAEAARAAEERHKRLRAAVSLMRRDLAGLAEYGADTRPDLSIWDQFSDLAILTARALRRKLDMEELGAIEVDLMAALDRAREMLEPSETQIMSTNEVRSEHHSQNSNKNTYDLEPDFRKDQSEAEDELSETTDKSGVSDRNSDTADPPDALDNKLPNIPLGLVLAVCAEFKTYCDGPVRHWHDLVKTADILRPMLGISPSAWQEAKRHMGPEEAAVVVVAMLERFSDIRSPGGYLRSLTDKAAQGAFSCGPMIMALMRRDAA